MAWPRGPTSTDTLAPRCRPHHELKTRGLLRTRLSPDGSVETTMLSGLVLTTRPEPLPGYAPGEGHHTPDPCTDTRDNAPDDDARDDDTRAA